MKADELVDVFQMAQNQVREAIYKFVNERPRKRVTVKHYEDTDEWGDTIVVGSVGLRIQNGECEIISEDYRLRSRLNELNMDEMWKIISGLSMQQK